MACAYRYPQIEILVSTDNALDYGTQGFSKIDFAPKRQKSGNNVISWRSFKVKISWNAISRVTQISICGYLFAPLGPGGDLDKLDSKYFRFLG